MRKMRTGWVWGLAMILVGVAYLLRALNIPGAQDYLARYWPAVFILIGLGDLLGGEFVGGMFWLIIGVVIGLFTSGTINYSGNIWQIIWPIVLILIGLRFLVRPCKRTKVEWDEHNCVVSSAVFSGAAKRVSSQDFKGSSVRAVFGGAKLDLRDSKVAQEGAVIDVYVVFGGVEILVPKGTPVRIDIVSVFGGHEDKRSRDGIDEALPGITIRGELVFGGVEIKE